MGGGCGGCSQRRRQQHPPHGLAPGYIPLVLDRTQPQSPQIPAPTFSWGQELFQPSAGCEPKDGRIWPMVVLMGMPSAALGCHKWLHGPQWGPSLGVPPPSVPLAEDGGPYLQFGGTLCTTAPLCNWDTMGTGHLPALGDGTQAGMGSNPGINPIPPGWSKGRDREGWGRGKNRKIKEPPPPRAPGHCFGHCKLDFLKRKCFTGHKLSQKKRGGGGENCAIFLWMEKWG